MNFQSINPTITQLRTREKYCNKKTDTLSFGGATRLVANLPNKPRPFFSTEDFLKILNPFKSKTLGKIPAEILNLFPHNSSKIPHQMKQKHQSLTFLDELAEFCTLFPIDLDDKFNLKLASGNKVQLEMIGQGIYAKVFKIDTNNKAFAFKVFKAPSDMALHGAVPEIRADLNLQDQQYADFSKFHIGDFEKEWVLSEFIDESKDVASERLGQNIKDARPDLVLGDDHGGNRINDIRVDKGGIHKKTPSIKPKYGIFDLPESERAKYIDELLTHPEPQFRIGIAHKIVLYSPQEKIPEYIDKLLMHPDPETRKGMAILIGYLPEEQIGKYIDKVLMHTDSGARKGIASLIGYLPQEQIAEYIDKVLTHTDSEARKGIANQISYLARKQVAEYMDKLLKHPDSEARKGIANQIGYLPEEQITKYIDKLLAHPGPETKKGLLPRISKLSKSQMGFYIKKIKEKLTKSTTTFTWKKCDPQA